MAMKKREWSQTEFAARIGVAEPTVGRWLRGTRRPDAQSLSKIEMVAEVPARMWGLPPFDACGNDVERKAG